MYLYICMYVCMHVYTYIYAYVCIFAYLYICTYTYIWQYMVPPKPYLEAFLYTCMLPHVYTHARARMD